jgi:hypothetical protein
VRDATRLKIKNGFSVSPFSLLFSPRPRSLRSNAEERSATIVPSPIRDSELAARFRTRRQLSGVYREFINGRARLLGTGTASENRAGYYGDSYHLPFVTCKFVHLGALAPQRAAHSGGSLSGYGFIGPGKIGGYDNDLPKIALD